MAGALKLNSNRFLRLAACCNCRVRSEMEPSSNLHFRRNRGRCAAWPRFSAPSARRRMECFNRSASSRSTMTTTADCGRRWTMLWTVAGWENPRSSTCRERSRSLRERSILHFIRAAQLVFGGAALSGGAALQPCDHRPLFITGFSPCGLPHSLAILFMLFLRGRGQSSK
jgi:hypothetical protein